MTLSDFHKPMVMFHRMNAVGGHDCKPGFILKHVDILNVMAMTIAKKSQWIGTLLPPEEQDSSILIDLRK